MVLSIGGTSTFVYAKPNNDSVNNKTTPNDADEQETLDQDNFSSPQQTGSPLIRLLKSGARFVSDQLRPEDENYLKKLTGDNEVRNAISQFLLPLSDALTLLFPDYINKIGGHDKTVITRITENLALHVLANFGKAFFGSTPKEITKEIFFGKLGYFLIKLFWKHFSIVDKETQSGTQPSVSSFKPLAGEILDIALPRGHEGFFSKLFVAGEKKIATNYTLQPLSEFFLFFYQMFILREKKSDAASSLESLNFLKEKEKLKSLIALVKQGIGFFINSFANHVICKEDAYFYKITGTQNISKLITSFQPLINKVNLLPEGFKEYVSESVLSDLTSLLLMTILGSITREYIKKDAQEKFDISKLFENITSVAFNNIFEKYKNLLVFIEKKKRVKAKYFHSFIKKIFKTLMPEQNEFFQFLFKRFPELLDMIATCAMDIVLAIDTNHTKVQKQQLRTLLWNKKEILAKHPTLSHLPDVPKKALSQAFGNEILVENIFIFCHEIGEKCLTQIKDLIGNKEVLYELLITIVPELDNCEDLPDVLKGIGTALLSEQPSTEALLDYIKKWIGSIIFKGCVIFLINSSPNRKLEAEKLLPVALKKGIEVLGRQFSNIQQNLENYKADSKKPSYEFFIPLIEELVHLLFHNQHHEFKDILPLPKWVQPQVAKALTSCVLPMFLNKCYDEVTVWQKQKRANQKKLATLFGNKRANEACRVLAHFVPEFLAYYFRTSSKELANIVLNEIKTYLIHNSPKDLKQIENLLTSSIKFMGIKTQYFNKLWKFLNVFSESIFLKIFIRTFEKIDAMERLYLNDPHKSFEGGLNIQIALQFIGDATNHFQTVNSIKKSIGERRASKVSDTLMLKGFKATHPFIKSLTKTDQHFQSFFENFSKKAIKFLDLDENSELPLPRLGRSTTWDLSTSKLLPAILNALFNKITSLQTIHQIVLSALQRTNEAIDRSEKKAHKKISNGKVFKVPDDHLQRELAQMCGDLIGALVDLHPSGLPKEFLEQRNIRLKVGHAIAESLRPTIEGSSTLELCDQIIESSLSSVHPGRWVRRKNQAVNTQKTQPKDRFIPHKLHANGKITKGFSFPFPKTKKEEKAYELKKNKEDQKIAKTVVSELSGMISKQTKLTLNAGLRGMWKNFQIYLNNIIKNNFDSFGLQVKHALDVFFKTIFNMLIYPIIRIIIFPIIKLSSLFLDIYLKNQAKWRAGDLGIKINQYLFLKTFDSVLNILEERNRTLVKS